MGDIVNRERCVGHCPEIGTGRRKGAGHPGCDQRGFDAIVEARLETRQTQQDFAFFRSGQIELRIATLPRKIKRSGIQIALSLAQGNHIARQEHFHRKAPVLAIGQLHGLAVACFAIGHGRDTLHHVDRHFRAIAAPESAR